MRGSASFAVPGGMIERSLHSPPCLTAHKLPFLKLQWEQLSPDSNTSTYPKNPTCLQIIIHLLIFTNTSKVTLSPKWLQVSIHTWNRNPQPNISAYLMATSLQATNAEFQLSGSPVAHNNKLIVWKLVKKKHHSASCFSSSCGWNTILGALREGSPGANMVDKDLSTQAGGQHGRMEELGMGKTKERGREGSSLNR